MSGFRDFFRSMMRPFREDEDAEAARLWYQHATAELRAYAVPLQTKRISISYMAGPTGRLQGPRQAALVLKHALTDIGAVVVGTDEAADARVEIRGRGGPASFTIRGESVSEARQRECHPDLLISSIIENLAQMFRGST